MDGTADLVSALLSRAAGILEDASAIAASVEAAARMEVAVQLQREIADASALLAVAELLGSRAVQKG